MSSRTRLVSLGFLPKRTPRAFARALPSLVRARISDLSNSASPPRTVIISLPWAVVVSAQASLRERKAAARSPICARLLSRSRVDLAKRSSLVTRSTSPAFRAAIALASCALSVLAPLCFSGKGLRANPKVRRKRKKQHHQQEVAKGGTYY